MCPRRAWAYVAVMAYLDSHPVVDKAIQLQPLLVKHRLTADSTARIADPVYEALAEQGMFRMTAPVEVGGAELDYPHVLAAVEEIAAGDITASWYVVNSIPIGLRSGYLATEDRDRVMARRSTSFAVSGVPAGRAIPVEGGFELSGQWPLVTGCAESSWAMLPGVVTHDDHPPDAAPDVRHFMVEAAELQIQDNWRHVAGMRGTGSNGVILDKTFVPTGLAQSPLEDIVLDRPLYRLPLLQYAATTSVAAVLGAWRSGLECIVEAMTNYRSETDGTSPSDAPHNQELVAHADANLRAARGGFAAVVDELWDALQTPDNLPDEVRGRVYATMAYTIDAARESISRLYAASSRATFEHNHPAEQALRNIHAFSNPLDRFRRFSIDAGRVIFNREPQSALY